MGCNPPLETNLHNPRRFVRHPSDVPIKVTPCDGDGSDVKVPPCLQNAGIGGLCFQHSEPYAAGAEVSVSIPVSRTPLEMHCRVVWCRPRNGAYEIGVEILEPEKQCSARMVEQVCHIEHYKREVLEKEGRSLTGQQAAFEWITQYAGEFPRG